MGRCTMWHLLIECFLQNAYIIYEETESVSITCTHPCTLQHPSAHHPAGPSVCQCSQYSLRIEFYLTRLVFMLLINTNRIINT